MDGNHPVTATILAGGLGTRLQGCVADLPKVLAPVGGRPWLMFLLERLAEQGIRRVVLCTGHLGSMVEECLGHSWGGVEVSYSMERSPLGTAGALRQALDLVGEGDLLALNGDSYCHTDLPRFLAWIRRRSCRPALVVTPVDEASRFGTVEVDRRHRVLSFREKEEHRARGLINAGIYYLPRRVLADLPVGSNLSLEREILPELVDQGLYGYRSKGPFIDIGTPESYALAREFTHRLVLA